MDYQFDLVHNSENYYHENKVVFDHFHNRTKKSAARMLIYGIVLFCLGLGYNGSEPIIGAVSFTCASIFALLALGVMMNYSKSKKLFQNRLKELSHNYAEHPTYSVTIDDDGFGSKDYFSEHKYRWTKDTTLTEKSDLIMIEVYPRNLHYIVLTTSEIGADKLKEVIQNVRLKIEQLKDDKLV